MLMVWLSRPSGGGRKSRKLKVEMGARGGCEKVESGGEDVFGQGLAGLEHEGGTGRGLVAWEEIGLAGRWP